MCYQIAKEVGAMATALCGKVGAIGLTGSLAHSEYIVSKLKHHISFIAPVYLYPGEKVKLLWRALTGGRHLV
jgi:butyrate kinase